MAVTADIKLTAEQQTTLSGFFKLVGVEKPDFNDPQAVKNSLNAGMSKVNNIIFAKEHIDWKTKHEKHPEDTAPEPARNDFSDEYNAQTGEKITSTLKGLAGDVKDLASAVKFVPATNGLKNKAILELLENKGIPKNSLPQPIQENAQLIFDLMSVEKTQNILNVANKITTQKTPEATPEVSKAAPASSTPTTAQSLKEAFTGKTAPLQSTTPIGNMSIASPIPVAQPKTETKPIPTTPAKKATNTTDTPSATQQPKTETSTDVTAHDIKQAHSIVIKALQKIKPELKGQLGSFVKLPDQNIEFNDPRVHNALNDFVSIAKRQLGVQDPTGKPDTTGEYTPAVGTQILAALKNDKNREMLLKFSTKTEGTPTEKLESATSNANILIGNLNALHKENALYEKEGTMSLLAAQQTDPMAGMDMLTGLFHMLLDMWPGLGDLLERFMPGIMEQLGNETTTGTGIRTLPKFDISQNGLKEIYASAEKSGNLDQIHQTINEHLQKIERIPFAGRIVTTVRNAINDAVKAVKDLPQEERAAKFGEIMHEHIGQIKAGRPLHLKAETPEERKARIESAKTGETIYIGNKAEEKLFLNGKSAPEGELTKQQRAATKDKTTTKQPSQIKTPFTAARNHIDEKTQEQAQKYKENAKNITGQDDIEATSENVLAPLSLQELKTEGQAFEAQ